MLVLDFYRLDFENLSKNVFLPILRKLPADKSHLSSHCPSFLPAPPQVKWNRERSQKCRWKQKERPESWVSYAVDLMRELDHSTRTLCGLIAPLFLPGLGFPASVGLEATDSCAFVHCTLLTCTDSPCVCSLRNATPFSFQMLRRDSAHTVPGHRHLMYHCFPPVTSKWFSEMPCRWSGPGQHIWAALSRTCPCHCPQSRGPDGKACTRSASPSAHLFPEN